jgi:hypothetical protein
LVRRNIVASGAGNPLLLYPVGLSHYFLARSEYVEYVVLPQVELLGQAAECRGIAFQPAVCMDMLNVDSKVGFPSRTR